MTHDEAIEGGATERYILEQMEEEERDAFEDHYFDCVICAEDVKAAIAVRDNLAAERIVHVQPPIQFEPHRQRRLATPIASIAASIAVVLCGWLQFVRLPAVSAQLAEAKQPYVAPQIQIEGLRGGIERQVVPHGPVQLELRTPEADPKLDFRPPYKSELVGRGKPLRFSSLAIIIPPGFERGDYQVRVIDADGKLVYEVPIAIQ